VINFDRSTVKHALQNTQNEYHQWLSDSSRVYQIRFSAEAFPRIPLGELTVLPRPTSWFKGALLLNGGKGRERKKVNDGIFGTIVVLEVILVT